MRALRKHPVLTTGTAILVVVSGVFLWLAFDWPPPRLLLAYGLPPAGGPTGRKMEVEGLEFVEISAGYFRMGSHFDCEPGDLTGRIGAALGLEVGVPPRHGGLEITRTLTTTWFQDCPVHWVEAEKPFWIATTSGSTDSPRGASSRIRPRPLRRRCV